LRLPERRSLRATVKASELEKVAAVVAAFFAAVGVVAVAS
jgi:hypothetical protein